MPVCAIYKADNYDEENLYNVIKKHFEVHDIKSDIPANAKVLIKPNLVTDKEAPFAITTNPVFVKAVIRNLKEIGVNNITVADCPGGALLLFSDIVDVYKKTGYSTLSNDCVLNTDFSSADVKTQEGFVNEKFNIINPLIDADYIINLPKLKTHNLTCLTCGVKNLFGCIPGLQKPAFHAKYPSAKDFSNMLVELACTVNPNFTIVDAIDIMEGDGPTNGKKRHLGLTLSSKDVFSLDKYIAYVLDVPNELVSTVVEAEKKGLTSEEIHAVGDTDFIPESPLILPRILQTDSKAGKIAARIRTLFGKIDDAVFAKYPQMNKRCVICKKCVLTCPNQALTVSGKNIAVDKKLCIGCLCCDEVCPNSAVDIKIRIKF